MLHITEDRGSVTFKVRVQPRSSKNGVVGLYEDALKLRLAAPPLEGKANEACRAYLAELLSVPRSHVEIVAGLASRSKIIRVRGVNADKVNKLILQAKR